MSFFLIFIETFFKLGNPVTISILITIDDLKKIYKEIYTFYMDCQNCLGFPFTHTCTIINSFFQPEQAEFNQMMGPQKNAFDQTRNTRRDQVKGEYHIY